MLDCEVCKRKSSVCENLTLNMQEDHTNLLSLLINAGAQTKHKHTVASLFLLSRLQVVT